MVRLNTRQFHRAKATQNPLGVLGGDSPVFERPPPTDDVATVELRPSRVTFLPDRPDVPDAVVNVLTDGLTAVLSSRFLNIRTQRAVRRLPTRRDLPFHGSVPRRRCCPGHRRRRGRLVMPWRGRTQAGECILRARGARGAKDLRKVGLNALQVPHGRLVILG